MRINHNMMAINTHRQMLVSQSDGAKSMEKLSSGYRVNRASDDAAGLAISEKMRGQIRGLSQASRNAQDTISLIQVAEGALAESHSILQRMRELSVQSATDTNTDADRVELNNELQQLKNELDRIGNSTEFNTRKLIEGSAKGVAEEIDGTARINNNSNVVVDSLKQAAMFESIGSDKSWGFDGAFMLLKTNQTFDINNDPIYNAADFKLVGPDGRMYDFRELSIYTTVNPGELEHGVIVAVTPEQFNFDSTVTVGGGAPNALPNGTTFDNGVTVAEDVDDTKVDTVAAGSLLAAGTRIVGDSIKIEGYTGLLNGDITFTGGPPDQFDFTLNGEAITVSGNDIRTIALDDGTVLELDAAKATITVKKGNIILDQDLASPLQPGTTITAGSTLSANSKLIGDVLIQANYRLTAGELGANVTIGNNIRLTEADVVKLQEGTILAKGSEITLLDEVELKLNVAGTEIGVIYDADLQILKVNGVVVAPNKTTTLDDGTVLINRGNGIVEVATGKITMARDMVPASATPPLAGQNIASYKIAKDSTLMAGTEVAVGTLLEAGTVVSEKNKPHYPGSVTLGSYGKSVQFSSNDGNRLEARYHEMKVTEGITFIFSRYEPASNNLKDSIMAQIGANSGQTTFVSMADMRSRALGVADVDIATKWGAATGIETVNNAVQRVSHQRALLGATQNRLEHTISNLDTAAENMQAAESRIRDVDMAREIMENTKQNILQQAAQAMLAQANQIPQNVLQLLR